jgi:glyoxylate/hydroxypyruvate reductase
MNRVGNMVRRGGLVVIRNDDITKDWVDALRHAVEKRDLGIDVYNFDEEHSVQDVIMAAVWKPPPGSLAKYPNLKGVQALGAGVDFLFADKTIPSSVKFMRVVDPYLGQDMAEFALALTMGALKNLPFYHRKQQQLHWTTKAYRRIEDTTVGIMGLGTLGLDVAKILERNDFQLCGWTRSSKPQVNFPTFQGKEEMNQFLSKSDILICLLPWTNETTGLLNADAFSALKEGAHLINIARGPIIVDEDLIEALDSGKLSGASLDVFHTEPLPTQHPFWKHEKVAITPHVASVTDISSVVPQVLRNFVNLENDNALENEVFRDRGY